MSDGRVKPEDLARLLGCFGVLPVVELHTASVAVPLANALSAGGLPVIEITFRAAGAAEAIAAVRAACPEVIVAAGTVLTVQQADAALDAGADFIVAPGTNPSVVEHVVARGGVMLPGVATPSEIDANLERGIRTLKLFPAETLGGTAFLRAIRGPYRQASFVPTGGLSASNLRDYLAEPNVCACGGTWTVPSPLIEAGDLSKISGLAREAAAIVREMRNRSAAEVTDHRMPIAGRGGE